MLPFCCYFLAELQDILTYITGNRHVNVFVDFVSQDIVAITVSTCTHTLYMLPAFCKGTVSTDWVKEVYHAMIFPFFRCHEFSLSVYCPRNNFYHFTKPYIENLIYKFTHDPKNYQVYAGAMVLIEGYLLTP